MALSTTEGSGRKATPGELHPGAFVVSLNFTRPGSLEESVHTLDAAPTD